MGDVIRLPKRRRGRSGRRNGTAIADGKTRAVAYLRVSTDKQADHGVSLDAQAEAVRRYADLYHIEIAEVISDPGESASTLDRPGLQRALDMLRAGTANALLVAKLDRLTRRVNHLGDLLEELFEDGHCALLSVGEQIDTRSANGRMMLNVMATMSQWEREAIGERTATAMRHKASRGEYTGGHAPYGFQRTADGVRLEPHPGEQAIIAAAREIRGRGMSLRYVGRALENRGLWSRTGEPWNPGQIARMCETTAAEGLL